MMTVVVMVMMVVVMVVVTAMVVVMVMVMVMMVLVLGPVEVPLRSLWSGPQHMKSKEASHGLLGLGPVEIR